MVLRQRVGEAVDALGLGLPLADGIGRTDGGLFRLGALGPAFGHADLGALHLLQRCLLGREGVDLRPVHGGHDGVARRRLACVVELLADLVELVLGR
ncbi:hypothetical protein D3C87_1938540 [compost metagenome]